MSNMKKRSIHEARKVNKTGFKTFDKLARDPRIVEIWNEGNDGIWVDLAPGFNLYGCGVLTAGHSPWKDRKATVAEMALALSGDLSMVEKGETY